MRINYIWNTSNRWINCRLFQALHLKEKHFHLQVDKDRLSELVKSIASTEEQDTRLKQQLVARRRQLFLELAEIFPIVQVL